jgi:transposase
MSGYKQRKLSDEAIRQMRCLRQKGGYSIKSLAERFGVSFSTARDILEYVNYSDVLDMSNEDCKKYESS